MPQKETGRFKLREFRDRNGRSFFGEWLDSLELSVQARIIARLFHLEQGNVGDYKGLGKGIYELRFMFGAGLRIYFGRESDDIVVLLCAGDKNSQYRDIRLARQYWIQYLKGRKGDSTI